MSKSYKPLSSTMLLGRNLEDVVNVLLEHKAKGELVSINFNGIMLYSDTVDMDEAHLAATGLNRRDFNILKDSIAKSRMEDKS